MDNKERDELVCRLFAHITAKLEDAATEALDGQRGGQDRSVQVARAETLEIAARDIGLLAEATAAILRKVEPPQATQ